MYQGSEKVLHFRRSSVFELEGTILRWKLDLANIVAQNRRDSKVWVFWEKAFHFLRGVTPVYETATL